MTLVLNQSSDPVIPKKETFIKAKYLNLAYTIRPSKDEENTLLDLNRQLWSCVRTSHVETTLRLLALGADPNYSDSEKGNCPLHIAAKEGQMLQAELLWIYGADVAQKNSSGHSPSDLAKMEGHVSNATNH
jgi:ankyrin repeat protein